MCSSSLGALTHSDLAYHAVVTRLAFFLEAHMWEIHAVQAVVDWGFIYMVLIRPRRPHRVRTPLAEAAGLSEVALAIPTPRCFAPPRVAPARDPRVRLDRGALGR